MDGKWSVCKALTTNMRTLNNPLPLPGGVGLTHLKVYDSPAPDGIRGGSAHVHFTCTEAYYVLRGRGRVQTLSYAGYAETPLETGQVVYFSPGVIHRLVNDGELEILVVMQNAGLPEAGDFVLAFDSETLENAEKYARFAALSSHGEVYTSDDEAAKHRRDHTVEGFAKWKRRFETEGESALDEFYALALALVQPKLQSWRAVWQGAPLEVATQTGEQLDALERGDIAHLKRGILGVLPAPDENRKWGMCGTLGIYPLPTFAPITRP